MCASSPVWLDNHTTPRSYESFSMKGGSFADKRESCGYVAFSSSTNNHAFPFTRSIQGNSLQRTVNFTQLIESLRIPPIKFAHSTQVVEQKWRFFYDRLAIEPIRKQFPKFTLGWTLDPGDERPPPQSMFHSKWQKYDITQSRLVWHGTRRKQNPTLNLNRGEKINQKVLLLGGGMSA